MSKAIKKNQLYSSLWESCDQLRGGMDASQYKDYVLTLLFVKYVSDKATGSPYDAIEVPEGGSFTDMIALKNKSNIGEGMDMVVAKLAEANGLQGVITNAHFNDETKLGRGKEKIDTLTSLVGVFQNLDFSRNGANDDDLIGDAYEYLMRKFATESGKSKGQFYTPAEVARVLAQVVEIGDCTNRNATVYDPACGSGSLLIRVLAAAPFELAGYGQEKDNTTAGLAKMNAVLHGRASVSVHTGNTFADPHNFDTGKNASLQRFDYVVANPPFSMKNWKNGLEYCLERFQGYGDEPPQKNGDYAWLMHILASLKDTGKGAVILPHGVLTRGKAEATIRSNIVGTRRWIKAVIGLPPNLFYGTPIPACIVIIDKEHAASRDHILMIDASRGFVKDGSKNRLRECDIFRIVETFHGELEDDPTYSRKVPLADIMKNGCDLNLRRYLQSPVVEDVQDIEGHLLGGISESGIRGLNEYWDSFDNLEPELFEPLRPGYSRLRVERHSLRETIEENAGYAAYRRRVEDAYETWMAEARQQLEGADSCVDAQSLAAQLANGLLADYAGLSLMGRYDVYQAFMQYWADTMADDVALVARDGWSVAREVDVTYKTRKRKVNGETVEVATNQIKDFDGVLVPAGLLARELFADDVASIVLAQAVAAAKEQEAAQLIEDADDGSAACELAEGKATAKRARDIIKESELAEDDEDCIYLRRIEGLLKEKEKQEKAAKGMQKALDEKVRERYATLTDDEILSLLIDKKWLPGIYEGIDALYTSLITEFCTRVGTLAERYEKTLPAIERETEELEAKVAAHLQRMGFAW